MTEIKILRPQDAAAIAAFEKNLLKASELDEVEREFRSWHSSWRSESLDHYLPLGWSFGIWESDDLVGYFLAQPQLFTRGQTQTLWVEQLTATTSALKDELKDIARRVAREKHFQKVIFNDEQ